MYVSSDSISYSLYLLHLFMFIDFPQPSSLNVENKKQKLIDSSKNSFYLEDVEYSYNNPIFLPKCDLPQSSIYNELCSAWGKRFLKKLGSVLRVFRVRKRKNADTSNDESTILSNSESGIKTSETSSSQQFVYLRNFPEAKKAISLENITATVDYSTDNLNKLKRSHGTCDIFGAEEQNKIRCTKSLHRFCKVSDTSRCFLSYNAKLHDSTTWSRALNRVISPYTKNHGKNSTTTQAESEPLLPKKVDFFKSHGLTKVHTIDTKRIYSSKEHDLEKVTTTNSQCTDSYIQSERTVSSKYGETTHQQNTEKYSTITSFSSDIHSVQITEETPEPSEIAEEIICSINNKVMSSSRKIKDIKEKFGSENSKNHSENMETSIESKTQTTTSKISTGIQKSQILLEKQRVQVNMEFKTVRNEEGFALLKYDMKPADNDNEGNIIDKYAPFTSEFLLNERIEKSIRECDASVTKNTSSKTQSGSSTECDVVNLAQVDLLDEFRTTIANMRNVLDAIDVKKSIQGIIRQSISDKKINQHISNFIEPKSMDNIPTQINTVYNQLSTSTDAGFSSSRKKGYLRTQQTSDIMTNKLNTKAENPSASNCIKLLKNKRKKRRRINTKLSRKPANITTFSIDKIAKARTKPEKPQYNKCVVYHITQHKEAVDRCVGTSHSTSKRESMVLQKAFSALHFGPIQDFPVLLNKHENEENKNRELKCKMERQEITVSSSSNKKLTFKDLKYAQGESYRSNKQSFTTAEKKTASSYMTTPSTTANWFVFEPTPPLVLLNNQSTSDDTVFDKNSSSCSVHERPIDEDLKMKDTKNLVKYQVCDKVNKTISKDLSHIRITVNVPIEEILSKLKSERTDREDGIGYSISKNDQPSKGPNNCSCDFGIQVKKSHNNTSVQTIPRKLYRDGSPVHQENEQTKDSTTSLKRLSSFKKIFETKALGLNTNISGLIPQRSSNVYFSDQSTSCPHFLTCSYNDPKCSDKSISVELKSTSNSAVPPETNEFGVNTNFETEGFFLNLPRNRNKKKREQISRLFDGSDSSNFKFFEDSKLLYHVHDSSFYSSSRTDNLSLYDEELTKFISLHDGHKLSYVPIHNIASSVNIKMEPSNNRLSTVSLKNAIVHKLKDNYDSLASGVNKTGSKEADKIVKGLIFKLLSEKNFADFSVQCDNFVLHPQDEVEVGINTNNESKVTQIERDTETYYNVGELSHTNIQKVRFEDEVHAIGDEMNANFRSKYKINQHECSTQNKKIMKKDHTKKISSMDKGVSASPFFPEIDHEKIISEALINNGEKIDNDGDDDPDQSNKKKNHLHIIHNRRKSGASRISSESNLVREKQKSLHSKIEDSVSPIASRNEYERRSPRKKFQGSSSGTFSTLKLFPNDDKKVSVEKEKQTRNNSKMKQILNLNSFEKSRDSIVDLILYNLMKEIISETSDKLSEQGKPNVDSILTNFVNEFKCETENKNIRLVESTIQSLVKEINSSSLFINNENKNKKYIRTHQEEDEGVYRSKYVKKSSFQGKYRKYKHGFKTPCYYDERGIPKGSESQPRLCESNYISSDYQYDKGKQRNSSNGNTEKTFIADKGEQQYIDLFEKVRELENVTKQLVVVAQNQPLPIGKIRQQYHENRNFIQEYQTVYSTLIDSKLPKYSSTKKSKTTNRRKNLIFRRVKKNILNINYLKDRKSSPVVAISRNPRAPTTNIVINLSNWRSVSRERTSLKSTKPVNSITPTDEIEHKHQMDKTLILKIAEDMIERKLSTSHMPFRKLGSFCKTAAVNKNKTSFTITISEGNKKKKEEPGALNRNSIRKRRDCIKIKMMRRKLASSNDHLNSDYHSSEKNNDDFDMNEVFQLTKEYAKKEYALKSGYLCPNIAKSLLGSEYNIARLLGHKGNLDLAYQRMANFCMFRGLLKKKQKQN